MENTEEASALHNLKVELEAERDWRINEFARIKKLFLKIGTYETEEYVKVYLKMTVPTIYAHWEGFCIASFKILSEYINAQELETKDVTYNILTYANENTYNKLKGKQSFVQKVEFSELFSNILFGKLAVNTRINTKSNLNETALKEIFEQFQLDFSKIAPYSRDLNAFVNVRNAIAHGENSILIDEDKMKRYIDMVVHLMDEVLLEQIRFGEEKHYLKQYI